MTMTLPRPTIGATRKLARDLRPGDRFHWSGQTVTVAEVSIGMRSVLVKYRTARGVKFTHRFLPGDAVLPID